MKQVRRKYISRVEVYINDAVSDGSGGNTVSERLIASSWANIKTVDVKFKMDIGLDIAKEAVIIKTRFRNDLDYTQSGLFFKYRGICWMPHQITNENLTDEEIKIIAYGV